MSWGLLLASRSICTSMSLCTVLPPCLTVNPQPDRSLTTEPSLYITMSWGLLLASRSICTSALAVPAGHSQQCVPRFSDSRVGRNSSVGCVLSSLSCLMQHHGFDPPWRRIFPVEGIFPVELTWVLTLFRKKLFQMGV